MTKATNTIPFTIEVNGKTYNCERIVFGTREFTQTIRVVGIGSEPDTARYGSKRHRPESMESIAKHIAREIALKAEKQADDARKLAEGD